MLDLTLFRMGLFGVAHGVGGEAGGAKRPPLCKNCHTYPTLMNLGSSTLPKEDPENTSIA